MMKLLGSIYHFFVFWHDVSSKYKKIKQDEEKRKKSKTLGLHSIILTVLCTGLAILSAYGVISALSMMQNKSFIVGVVLLIFCVLCAICFTVQGILKGFLYLVYQLRLNRRLIGWVALGIWIACVVALIIAVVLLAGKI